MDCYNILIHCFLFFNDFFIFIFFKMVFVDFIFFILSWLRIQLCSFLKKKKIPQYIFLKNYLYRIYFFNIELADNLALQFFFFSKIIIFYIFYYYYFLSFSLKHCSFPHVFFFRFCFLFCTFFFHFFYPKLTSLFFLRQPFFIY